MLDPRARAGPFRGLGFSMVQLGFELWVEGFMPVVLKALTLENEGGFGFWRLQERAGAFCMISFRVQASCS